MTQQSTSAPPTTDPRPWWRRTQDQDAFDEAKRRLRQPMTVLALVFTVALVAEFTRDLQPWGTVLVVAVNVAIWVLFAIEYLWLLRLAPDRWHFVRTHVVDLFVVLLPMVRPLRSLRVLRVLTAAARSWRQVFSVLHHRGLGRIISAVGALMIVGGLITFALERETFGTIGNAVWWVLVTSTTVGYGDFAPVGGPARAVAVIVMLLGIGLVGVITANIVDFMSTDHLEDRIGRAPSVGTDATCEDCRTIAERLTAIESQLSALLARGVADGTAADSAAADSGAVDSAAADGAAADGTVDGAAAATDAVEPDDSNPGPDAGQR